MDVYGMIKTPWYNGYRPISRVMETRKTRETGILELQG